MTVDARHPSLNDRAHCALCQAMAAVNASASPRLAPAHPGRRLFTSALLASGLGVAVTARAQQHPPREGVDVGRPSGFARMVSAEQLEQAAAQQYRQMLREAEAQKALGGPQHPQVVRLRFIAERMIPHAHPWNARSRHWQWEINLIGSKQINAFCMPGGKIAFYSGILQRLKLTDDEVAMIMGHEMAHALREHARERIGKTAATRVGASLLSSLLGLGGAGDLLLGLGTQLLTLKFSREDESEADLVGLDLGARTGYDPRAGVSLWNKMMEASKGAPPQFLSTHPAGTARIREIESVLPRVLPLYERAPRPPRRFEPA
jgi:predicted Zn-dependent protease